MSKWIGVLIFFSLISYCCNRKKYICPAYNTYFIHDEKERDKLFMPFHVDSLNEGSAETTETPASSDSTSTSFNSDNSGQKGKFHPKDETTKDGKRLQPNGLVINSSGKKKPRKVNDIEMKIIMAKPTSSYSNVDSSSLKQQADSLGLAPSDTL